MSRTALTALTALGTFPTLQPTAGSMTVTMTGNATAADGVSFPLTGGRQLLIVNNTNAGAQTFTVESVADEKGRTGDITTYSLAAAGIGVFLVEGPAKGWRQSDGTLYVKGSHADVKFGMVNLS